MYLERKPHTRAADYRTGNYVPWIMLLTFDPRQRDGYRKGISESADLPRILPFDDDGGGSAFGCML